MAFGNPQGRRTGSSGCYPCCLLKQIRPEYALYISLATCVVILILASGRLSYVFEMVEKLQSYIPVDSVYLTALMKMVGITYVGQFASGLCRDAGYSAVASQIELFAKISILALSMPVLAALLETIQEFLA